jgi:hypothetical protein
MKTYDVGGPRRFRTPLPKTRKTPPPGSDPGMVVLGVLALLVLLGLSTLFRMVNPDPAVQRPVDPNAPVVERQTFQEVR